MEKQNISLDFRRVEAQEGKSQVLKERAVCFETIRTQVIKIILPMLLIIAAIS